MRAALVFVATLAAPPAFAQAVPEQSSQAPAAGRVTGRVVTGYAELLPEAAVSLTGGPPPGRHLTAASGPRGDFTFDAVPPGVYTVAAAKPGYTALDVSDGTIRAAPTLVVREGDAVPDLDVTLRRAGSISGRVVKPDGTPAPDVWVVPAVRRNGALLMLFDVRATSEWDGRYAIGGLPPGEFLVVAVPSNRERVPEADLPDHLPSPPRDVPPTLYPGVPESQPGESVAVHEGLTTDGIDIWLSPAPQRFAVSGRVTWPDGVAVDNVAIEYGGAPDVRSGVWYVNDPGGLFTLTGLSLGPLVMLARADSPGGPLAGLATTEIVLGDVDDIRLELGPASRVAGRVVAERPLPDGVLPRVALTHQLLRPSPLFPREEAAAAADGRFEIPRAHGLYQVDVLDLPPGWRVLRVLRDGRPLPDRRLLAVDGRSISGLEIEVAPATR